MLRKVTFILVALSISACAYAVEFNDGGIHVIDYMVMGSIWVDLTQAPQPGTHIIFVDGARQEYGIQVYHHGQVKYYGGDTMMPLNAYDDATVTIQDGLLFALACRDNSHAVVWGGKLEGIETHSTTTQVVIHGQDFTLDGEPIGYGEVVLKNYNPSFYYGRLKGNLPHNPQLNVQCLSYSASGPNSRVFLVPAFDCPRADLNNDCKVDFFDLAILASEWLASGV